MSKIYVKNVAHYHPEAKLTNAYLETVLDTSDEWIQNRVGIKERRYMNDYTGPYPVFEIGRRVVEKMFAADSELVSKIDCVISSSAFDDLHYPTPASMLTEHFCLNVPAFHVKTGCSSVLYALQVAKGLIYSGYRNILVVSGEPFTYQSDMSDRRSAILFGDASAAFVVSCDEGDFLLHDVTLGGQGSRIINTTSPGAKPKKTLRAEQFAYGAFQQDGAAVADFVVTKVPTAINDFLAKCKKLPEDIQYFIGHQANLSLLQQICDKVSISHEKHLHNIADYGNTSSAGWVTVLSENFASDRFRSKDLILCSVFGAGMAWGTTLLEAC